MKHVNTLKGFKLVSVGTRMAFRIHISYTNGFGVFSPRWDYTDYRGPYREIGDWTRFSELVSLVDKFK